MKPRNPENRQWIRLARWQRREIIAQFPKLGPNEYCKYVWTRIRKLRYDLDAQRSVNLDGYEWCASRRLHKEAKTEIWAHYFPEDFCCEAETK